MAGEKVRQYYNDIAKNYDESRFSNSYGKFIDDQERKLLTKYLKGKKVLNLGCGTGRFMELSTDGLDFSEEMLSVAQLKYPAKQFVQADASSTPYKTASFDTIICFHVIMHQNETITKAILKEIDRLLKPGGQLIIDYPTAERRKLTKGHHQQNWHGSNAFKKKEFRKLMQTHNWQTINRTGILFLPIHRLPVKLRPYFKPIDQIFSRSPIKKYASYIVHIIKKPLA